MLIKRAKRPVSAMTIHKCSFEAATGKIYPIDGGCVKMGFRQLANMFPWRTFEYAAPGDYIGLVKKENQVVDFQVSPTHNNLCDIQWMKRVVVIARVVNIDRSEIV